MSLINHVAIIMDGNGRWGLKKKNSRKYGHIQGLQRVQSILKSTIDFKIPYLTLYAFSTENWKRPSSEVNFLFKLIKKYFKKNLEQIVKKNIKVSIIGVKKGFPKDVKNIIKKVEKKTKENKRLSLILALNYGSKQEILQACKKIKLKKKKYISQKDFEKELYTSKIPNPDILIRTGGKKRLSNFLLWQLAYSELFFLDKMWPDFNEKDYVKIINKFRSIKRNFGNI